MRRDPILKERRRSRATSCEPFIWRTSSRNRAAPQRYADSKKPHAGEPTCGYGREVSLLRQPERVKRGFVYLTADRQTLVALEIEERAPRLRPEEPIKRAAIISAALQFRLDVGDHLPPILVVVAIERSVVRVGAEIRIIS